MDPLTEVAELLFGDGAYELVAKMNPASSDLSTQQKKRERTQARVGLASNVVGLGAGAAGTAEAYNKFREAKGLGAKVGPLARATAKVRTKHAVGLAAAGLGLQGLNIVGDAVANGVLRRSAQQDIKVTKPKTRKDYALAKAMPRLTAGRLDSVGDAALHVGEVAVGTGLGFGAYKLNQKRKHKKKAVIVKRHRHSPTCSHMKLTRGKLVATAIEGGAPHVKSAASKAGATGRPVLVSAEKQIERKLVAKSGELDIVWEGEFAKFDTDKRQVFGWASIVELNGEPVVDLQGDFIPADEIEKAAYEYVQKSRKGGDMHRRDGENAFHASEMIESFMVTPEKVEKMGLPPGSLPVGWWVGYQVHDDEVWNLVKSGKRTGFSIHGRGKRAEQD